MFSHHLLFSSRQYFAFKLFSAFCSTGYCRNVQNKVRMDITTKIIMELYVYDSLGQFSRIHWLSQMMSHFYKWGPDLNICVRGPQTLQWLCRDFLGLRADVLCLTLLLLSGLGYCGFDNFLFVFICSYFFPSWSGGRYNMEPTLHWEYSRCLK